MYLPYLMSGYGATMVLMLAAIRIAARTVPGLRGVRLLSWAISVGLVGVVLLAVRPFAPDWITILIANEAIFIACLLLYCAMAETLAVRPGFLPWGVGVALAALAANIYYTYLHADITVRIFICSGGCAVYTAAAAAMLFQYKEPDAAGVPSESALRSQTVALAWLLTMTVFQHIVRCVLTVRYPPVDFVHVDAIQTGFSYTNMVLTAGITCGVFWLALSVHRRDLQRIALTDSMTGLLNRRAFEEIMADEVSRCNHAGKSFAILLLDIDHFKDVNDMWGHQAGDEVIRRVSGALRKNMRSVDALSRFGGEEFVILLRNVSILQAEEIAWRLRAEIACLTDLPGGLRVTASVGVAANHLGETSEQVLRRCDEALYCSKRGGRDLVTVDKTPRPWTDQSR